MISGLILAGGRSLRMQNIDLQYIDKGLLPLYGEPLAAHARRFMLGQGIDTILVSANRNLDQYSAYGRVIVDGSWAPEGGGPLQGLAAALSVLRTPWLFVLPVDVVGLPSDLVARLCAGAGECGLAFAVADGPQPLCLVMHESQRASLLEFIAQGRRKVQDWLAVSGAQAVTFTAEEGAFLNINTPEDLLRASAQPIR